MNCRNHGDHHDQTCGSPHSEKRCEPLHDSTFRGASMIVNRSGSRNTSALSARYRSSGVPFRSDSSTETETIRAKNIISSSLNLLLESSTHSMCARHSITRGGPTRVDGEYVQPAGSWPEVSADTESPAFQTLATRSSPGMLITNSLVSRMLMAVLCDSLQRTPSIGGFVATRVSQLFAAV